LADPDGRSIIPIAGQSRARRAREPHRGGSALPVPLSAIVGRDALVEQVRTRLGHGDARLVTLTGPGGIGKTRVALEIAARLEDDYADGASFVPLAAERDPRQVPHAIAHALGIKAIGDADAEGILSDALQHRHLLLVLDNLEQVAGGVAPWLAELLPRCPRLHVIVTSRVGLQIAGELRVVVPPLPLPAATPSLSADAASDSPAVRLFVQRASEARADFTLTDANAATVAAICERLDGMPLAIELAAARVMVMSPATLLQRIDGQGEILAGDRPDLPERHRTIALAIAWSYALLSEAEQRVFRRVSIFAGGFSLDAVECIAMGEGEPSGPSTLDVLQALVNHSLVGHASDPADEVRFRMLEPVRRFALAQLAAAQEETAARDAHADWCMALAAGGWNGMKGPHQADWIDRLEREHANLRAATAWLLDTDRVEAAIATALRLTLFRHFRGHTSELAALYDRFLSHPRLAAPSLARGQALLCRGSLAQTQYDPGVAIGMLQEAVALLHEHGAWEDEGAAQWLLGNVHRFTDDAAAAEPCFAACLALGRAHGDHRLTGVGLSHLGVTAAMRGELSRAETVLREAMQVAGAAGDTWVMSMIWVHLAQVAIARGDMAGAEARLREAEPLVRALGDKVGLLRLRVMIAEMAGRAGDHATADTYLEESLADAWTLGDKAYAARVLLERARRASRHGDTAAATADLREALRLHAGMGQPTGVVRCLGMLASLALGAGQPIQAARLLGMADARLAAAGIEAGAGEPETAACRQQLAERLGADAFAAAHAAGLALDRDGALAEAMSLELATAGQSRVDPAGHPPEAATLTRRELEVLRLLADGLSNEEIADALFISVRTAAGHVANLLTKLNLRSRTAAVAFAIRNGLA
jgi:predicted ATPase/DNA-binding CsgD family transcriptional regulator